MSDETDEELQLTAELQAMTEQTMAVSDTIKAADERLRKIIKDERKKHDRLLQINRERVENEQRKRETTSLEVQKKPAKEKIELQVQELEAKKSENYELKESLEKLKEKLQRATKYGKTQLKEKREKEAEIEKLTRRIKCLEDETSNAKSQRQKQILLNERQAELQAKFEALRIENEHMKADHSKYMTELQENLQRITSLSTDQQKTINCLKDEATASQQIAAETQLRQLNELQSMTEVNKQLKQTLTAQIHQQQQPTAADNLSGKNFDHCVCLSWWFRTAL